MTHSIKKILVIKLSSFGDIIHTFPSIKYMLENIKDNSIDWAVDSRFSEVVELMDGLNRVIPMELKKLKKPKYFFSVFSDIKKDIRHSNYDLVIDYQGLIKSGLVTYYTQAEKKTGFGFKGLKEKPAGLFYDEPISIPDSKYNVIIKNLLLTSAALDENKNIEVSDIAQYDRYLSGVVLNDFPNIKNKLKDKLKLRKQEKLLIVHPSTSSVIKDIPPSTLAKLIDHLSEQHNYRTVLCGSGRDITVAETIKKLCQSAKLQIMETSIQELKELITLSDLFVGADSGPLHLAAVMDKKCVGFYGPTDYRRNGPVSSNSIIIVGDNDCRYPSCWKKCRDNRCMKSIKVETVTEKLSQNNFI